MKIKVEINKNIVLVFCLLNKFNLLEKDDNNPVRAKVIEHFKDYKGKSPKIEEYIHESKLVNWALAVNDAPTFNQIIQLDEETQWHFDKGAPIKPYLIDFYNNTDFEIYYQEYLLNILNKMKQKIEVVISSTDLTQILENTWQEKLENEMIIIPNPLTQGGFGPKIGNINYQVISGIDRDKVLHKVLHEGSHPLAKKILKPYEEEINKLSYLLKTVQKNQNYPKVYNNWNICFEEHFIRATQLGLMDPKVIENYDTDKMLGEEIEDNGMIFINLFCANIMKFGTKNAISEIIRELSLLPKSN
ncbi:DUF4932 domain-containing protein [candidate division WWE3 bacterium]|nr:DUF4932 domain-containing protein [candidate division WWE3 bacterium]